MYLQMQSMDGTVFNERQDQDQQRAGNQHKSARFAGGNR